MITKRTKMTLTTITSSALLLALALPVNAEYDSDKTATNKDKKTTQAESRQGNYTAINASDLDFSRVDRASQIIGKSVENNANEELGSIDELVLNKAENRIAYAVLLHGDTMGVGGKWIAVPFKALRYDARQDCFVLNTTKAQLERAQGFDEDTWPASANKSILMSNDKVVRDANNHDQSDRTKTYNDRASEHANNKADNRSNDMSQDGKARTNQDHKRADHNIRADWSNNEDEQWQNRVSEIIGVDVVNKAGEELGSLHDLAINSHDGQVVYGVLEFSEAWYDYNGKLFPIPWSKFSYGTNSAEAQIELDANAQQFSNAEGFDSKNWPNMGDRAWGEETHRHYGAVPYWTTYEYPYQPPVERREMDNQNQNDRSDNRSNNSESQQHNNSNQPNR